MGRNTTAMKRGWNYDIPNSLLKAMVDGTEAFKLRKDSASVCAGYQAGAPTYTLAGQVDGARVSLATAYSASGSNRFSAFEINADTGATDLTGDTYQAAIKGALTVGTTQTNASLMGGLFSLDVGTVNLSANYFALRGHLDFWGNCTISGTSFVGALSAYVENEATTTVSASQYLMGLDIYQVGAPTVASGGFNPAIYVRCSASAAAWQKTLLVGANQHCIIQTVSSDKNIRLNGQTYTTAASIVGVQVKPRAGVNMTNEVIGIESMPGINSSYTGTGIVCFKAEPYFGSTTGALSGDVRGYEVSLGAPSGVGTQSGGCYGIEFINNSAKSFSGGIYPIFVNTHGDAVAWSGLMKLPDDGGSIADLASNAATINAVLKVVVGSTTTYLVGYTSYTAS